MENRDEIRYQEAAKRVKKIKGFYSHLGVYIVINIMIFILNAQSVIEVLPSIVKEDMLVLLEELKSYKELEIISSKNLYALLGLSISIKRIISSSSILNLFDCSKVKVSIVTFLLSHLIPYQKVLFPFFHFDILKIFF